MIGLGELGRQYGVIYADPPWSYRDKALAGQRGAICKYAIMSQAELCQLPVASIAADNCALFLWTTMPKLNEVMEVINSWGFAYKTAAFTWVKRNRRSAVGWHWGMGRWTRANAELCLLATRGKPARVSAAVHSVIETPVEQHSQKPAVVRDRIVQLCGDVPRIELFARQRVAGWDSWGLEVDSEGSNDNQIVPAV